MYRTSQGRMVDFESLQLKNETVVAVGNMRVNARGDELGAGGEVVRTNNQRVADYYATYSTVPQDEPPEPERTVIEESLPELDPVVTATVDRRPKRGPNNV